MRVFELEIWKLKMENVHTELFLFIPLKKMCIQVSALVNRELAAPRLFRYCTFGQNKKFQSNFLCKYFSEIFSISKNVSLKNPY